MCSAKVDALYILGMLVSQLWALQCARGDNSLSCATHHVYQLQQQAMAQPVLLTTCHSIAKCILKARDHTGHNLMCPQGVSHECQAITLDNVLMCNRKKAACLEDKSTVITIHSQQPLVAVHVFWVHLQQGPQEVIDFLKIHVPI